MSTPYYDAVKQELEGIIKSGRDQERAFALCAIHDAALRSVPTDGHEALLRAVERHMPRIRCGTFMGTSFEEVIAVLDEIDLRAPGTEPYDERLRKVLSPFKPPYEIVGVAESGKTVIIESLKKP